MQAAPHLRDRVESRAHPLLRLSLTLALAFACAGCPPGVGDDDDSGEPVGPVGDPPVVDGVEICEVPDSVGCQNPDDQSLFELEFRLTLSDVDGDLNNPQYFILVDAPPALNGRLEGDLGAGGILRIQVCNQWLRDFDFSYEAWVRDAESNESDRFEGTYTVPADSGDDDCEPLLPGG